MSEPANPSDRREQLRAARDRLTRLEVETHRLRAELARLEAAGEDAAAERLEATLRQRESDLADERRFDPVEPAPAPAHRDHSDHEEIAAVPTIETSELSATTKPKLRRDDAAHAKLRGPHRRRTSKKQAAEANNHPRRATANAASKRRRIPPWALSLGIHMAMLLVLGAGSFATLSNSPRMLLASSTEGEESLFDDLATIDLEQEPLDEIVPTELPPTELSSTELAPTELAPTDWDEIDLADAASLTEAVDPLTAFDALPTDFGSLTIGPEQAIQGAKGDATGNGRAGRGRGGRPRSAANFFGAKAEGGRFVFVVDNSGSMKEGRLETTLMEIDRSVARMSADQSFYVIFYSDQAYPMFFPNGVDHLMPATRDNKRRLAQWLPTVEMCVGGRLDQAIKLAASLEPDTVFVLSDGKIGGTRTMRMLTDEADWPFVIHTAGMTVSSPEDAQKLAAIAAANGGVFTPVGVHPAAAQRSQQRPVPYHREPGALWGSKVRKWN